VSTLAAQLWWTAADEAELDLLVHEFVKTAFRHREACAICRAGGPWCRPLSEAFEVVLDWRAGRVLRSKADWLRARQEAAGRSVAATRGGLF
jgi:hypothetical protein